MGRQIAGRMILGFGLVLALLVVEARADVTIEFANGHQMIVGQYTDEGQVIKIYTQKGTVSFRKADIKRITAVDIGQSMHMRLETLQPYTTLSPLVSKRALAKEQ